MEESHSFLNEKLSKINEVKELNLQLKETVLQFLFAFNVFESEFFKEPKWNESKTDKKFKHVQDRVMDIQFFCNDNNYPLIELKKFQLHFSEIYLENNIWSKRFKSLQKSEKNKNGYDEDEMKHLYDFLYKPLESNRKYAVKNALMLSYKFRNNMFHGNKDIRDLNEYKDDFTEIKDFLVSLMKFLRDKHATDF